jgi:hypothetical protein
MPWKARPREPLEKENDTLKTTIVRLRHDLANKEGAVGKLKVLLRSRTERIDELANTVAVLREQNRRLDAEADHLAELVRQPMVRQTG